MSPAVSVSALGPGQYEDLIEYVREQTGANNAVLIVLDGKRGPGLSAHLSSGDESFIPELLGNICTILIRHGMESEPNAPVPPYRVGALLSSTDEAMKFLGYGEYVGMESVTPDVYPLPIPNPKIVLENGDVVWGMECWWGPESSIRPKVESHPNVVMVRIADAREAAKEAEEND